jgi:hypothetical protein
VDLVTHRLGGAGNIEAAVGRATDGFPAGFLDPENEGGNFSRARSGLVMISRAGSFCGLSVPIARARAVTSRAG